MCDIAHDDSSGGARRLWMRELRPGVGSSGRVEFRLRFVFHSSLRQFPGPRMKDDPVHPFPQPAQPPGSAAALDLRAAVRRARVEEAERSGVAAELRGAELARLEMLKETLEPVFAQLPREAELFDMGLVPGEKPRLFVDMVAFVEMARDRRTFRFIQENRAGRLLIAESDRVDPVAEAVTAYLGRRLVERERALTQGDVVAPSPPPVEPAPVAAVAAPDVRRFSGGDVAFMTVLGMMVGAALLYTAILLRARGIDVLPILPRP
jgi:hypothetical protein